MPSSKTPTKPSSKDGKTPAKCTKVPCPHAKEDPKIISVQFLDGKDDLELKGNGVQIVNLTTDAKWIDGTIIKNIDRLSNKPRIKVSFNKPGSHSFKMKFIPDPSNSSYSSAEKNRNSNFKFQVDEKTYSTDSDGTKIITNDFFITSAGKDKYKLIAKDTYGNPEVQSETIETKRVIYYKEIKMRTLSSVAGNVTVFENELSTHGIKMVSLDSIEIDHIPNIGNNTETNTFKNSARTAYNSSNAPAKSPFIIAIGYTDHLAVKNPNKTVVKTGVQVGSGKPPVDLVPVGPGLTSTTSKARYLWKNIVPGEGWFVSAKYLKTGDTAGTDDITIPASKISAIPVNPSNPDKCKKMRVDVTGLPSSTGTITITVNWVDRMRGGLSFRGGNLVCVCTRAWWRNKSTQSQNETITHEVGHKIGMVANGTGNLPDSVSTYYTGKGHVGGHCHMGLSASLASYSGVSGSTCVMFGATNSQSTFCSNCSPAVKKLDVSGGWSVF